MRMCEWCAYTETEWLLYRSLHWSVYLADVQDYIGRCILVLNRHCGSLSELNIPEWMDLKTIIDRIEYIYREVLGAELSNWSCLLNNFYKEDTPDPHVHVHVRPRYQNAIIINDHAYEDTEFAHHYALKKADVLLDEDRQTLYLLMKKHFKQET
ncbi:MAG: HIT family protein [Christensenellaceae bacterium]|nr:HIT family protein [Christensenellaceae bacterium]